MMNHESFSSNPNSGRETPPTVEEVHEKKLLGYLKDGGNLDYINGSNNADWSTITEDDKENVLKTFSENPGGMISLEKNLLNSIKLPSDFTSPQQVFHGIIDTDSKCILAKMTRGVLEAYTDTNVDDLTNFLDKYPTPMDFEEPAINFLNEVRILNGDARSQEYNVAMASFCKRVYGKRYEYYETIKGLNRDLDGYREKAYNEALKQVGEVPIVDAGVCTINKARLMHEYGRANEDANYCNKGRSTFGVFDGAGGMGGAALASDAARKMMSSYVDNYDIKTPEDIRKMLVMANDAVRDTIGAGNTTGAVGKIIKNKDGEKKLIYGCVGDSRIYVIRDGDAIQVTKDEGEGHVITNCLGRPQASIEQVGDFSLEDNDKLLFCSDGITGDVPEDSIPTKEIAMMVMNAASAEDAAKNLAERATKIDDRTAIVVEI